MFFENMGVTGIDWRRQSYGARSEMLSITLIHDANFLNGNQAETRVLPEAVLMDETPVIAMAPRATAIAA